MLGGQLLGGYELLLSICEHRFPDFMNIFLFFCISLTHFIYPTRVSFMKIRAHYSQSFVLINLSLRGSPPGLVGDGGGVASIADALLARHAISTPPPPNERLLKRAVNCVSKLSAIPNPGSVLRTWTVFPVIKRRVSVSVRDI